RARPHLLRRGRRSRRNGGSMIGALRARVLLSMAKHPSLAGHARMALRAARLVPFYEYDERELFATDGAPRVIAERRRAGFERLAAHFARSAPMTLAEGAALDTQISDLDLVNAYRVPFQYRRHVRDRLELGCLVAEADGARVRDLDGNWS